MAVLFNNCRCRDHAGLYGAGAFFDLNLVGGQADMATDLRPGDECVVAAPVEGGDVEFNWYAFTHERVMDTPDEPSTQVRVQSGTWLRSERLLKPAAATTAPYSAFFDVNGHFKRRSVIKRGWGGEARRAEPGAAVDRGRKAGPGH